MLYCNTITSASVILFLIWVTWGAGTYPSPRKWDYSHIPIGAFFNQPNEKTGQNLRNIERPASQCTSMLSKPDVFPSYTGSQVDVSAGEICAKVLAWQ